MTDTDTVIHALVLIARSISHTEIAHAAYDADLAAEISGLSDDSVEMEDVAEYWGKTEDGAEWRVHLTGGAR